MKVIIGLSHWVVARLDELIDIKQMDVDIVHIASLFRMQDSPGLGLWAIHFCILLYLCICK